MESQTSHAAAASTSSQDRATQGQTAASTSAQQPATKSIRTVIKPRAPQVLQSMGGWGAHTEPAQLSFNFTRS